MGQDGFRVAVTNDVVNASLDDPVGARVIAGIILSGMATGLAYAAIFQRGKRPGLLVYVRDNPALFKEQPALLYLNVYAIVLILALFASMFIVGARMFFPSGSRLHCDRSTFTISQIAFWSFGNRWKTQSVSPSEVSDVRYGVVERGRGSRVYGILATVRRRKWKVLAGIDPSDAKDILLGLRSLGVNVCIGDELNS